MGIRWDTTPHHGGTGGCSSGSPTARRRRWVSSTTASPLWCTASPTASWTTRTPPTASPAKCSPTSGSTRIPTTPSRARCAPGSPHVTRHQAVQRLRQTEAASARDCGADAPAPAEIEQKIREASTAARADFIVTSMPAPLRAALELAYFQRRDYRQTAADLGVTEDEARRRLRLGLQLLSTAHNHQALPPAHRTAPTPRSAPAPSHSPHAPQAPHSPRGPRPPHTQHTGPGNSAPPGPGRGRSL